eukprot:TRINITY_DN337_c0_g1_i1.p1 TRINITY_DN337_c0_g1~~TRINITY_DN337_c0_g1_i1.p1  ORF type:complete len:108 (+),score=12.33 TRINITY_DN337_c0_g1_i1:87-410(+)
MKVILLVSLIVVLYISFSFQQQNTVSSPQRRVSLRDVKCCVNDQWDCPNMCTANLSRCPEGYSCVQTNCNGCFARCELNPGCTGSELYQDDASNTYINFNFGQVSPQ